MKNNENSNLFIEDVSKYDFNETVQKLTMEIEQKSWKVSAIHDLQQTLMNNGKEVLPIKVFALCHPKHSGRILKKDEERIVSSLMPCRISVYMKSDGKTYVSRMNSAILAKSIGGIIEEVMIDSSNEVEEILNEIILKNE